MLKKIDGYIIKEYFPPFILTLISIIFILSLDFIIKILDSILQKGIEPNIVFKYFFLNLAWIVALAVPMSFLVSSIMVFGRLASDNEIIAFMSVGVHPLRIMLTPILLGILAFGYMSYFNSRILPEANHKAAEIGVAIKKAKPASILIPNFIIGDIPEYKIVVGSIDYNKNLLKEIKIFNEKENYILIAERGKLYVKDDFLFLVLSDGEIIQYKYNKLNTEVLRLKFSKNQMGIQLPETFKKRKRTYRTDREMTDKMLRENINKAEKKLKNTNNCIVKLIKNEYPFLVDSSYNKKIIKEIPRKLTKTTLYNIQFNKMKKLNMALQQEKRKIIKYKKYISSLKVELYKKFSIAFASIIFILIGVPLGSIIRKGGIGVSIAVSFVIFMLYWAYLIVGERLADRLVIDPFIAMWGMNIILLILSIILLRLLIYVDYSINYNIDKIFLKFFKKEKK